MDETQSLDQALDSAVSPDAGTLKTNEEAPESSETLEPKAQSNEEQSEATEEETYTRIDPKSLPPELQAMHKSLLRDYTKKTQSLAQQRKEYEHWKSQVAQPQNEEAPQNIPSDINSQEPEDYIASRVNELLSQREQETQDANEQQYLERAAIEVRIQDERLNPESPAYDSYMHSVVGTELDRALDEYTQENGTAIGFDYVENAKNLIGQYEEYLDKRAQELSKQKTRKAFESVKRVAPLGASSSPASSKPVGGMSLDEAFENAFDTTN